MPTATSTPPTHVQIANTHTHINENICAGTHTLLRRPGGGGGAPMATTAGFQRRRRAFMNHEPDTSHNISGVVADNSIRAFNRTRMPLTRVHTGTRTGIHARADTHTHTHAHHVDIWFGVRPLHSRLPSSGDGYGHVLWPPRTSTTSAVPKTSTRKRVARARQCTITHECKTTTHAHMDG